ncbi:hypothetical protein N7492_009275 [Penicillium capsulatum]|uniref:Uncharacterized protein n=1 Tax=Penicillium capsulatum TaxID=69766 RepID=A0A9W9HTQ4_9EURO|nr:hypothetical protein N7492_009275 [Penicillium capsulatum]KAJ6106669.1 hypothetical protein N7512_010186 [Penicillium capsulatum]
MYAEPKLESLPIELNILILFRVPDGDTLQSLVLASPGYHHAYLVVREELLKSLLKEQYTEFLDLAEALIAVRSKILHFTAQRERAIALPDSWRRRNETRELSKPLPRSIHEPDGLEEIIDLLHFHRMLNFFEDFLVHAPRPPWIQAAQWENELLPLRLSCCEKQRFLRALCRFQVLRNIFGDAEFRRDHDMKVWQIGETGRSIDGSSESSAGTIVKEAYKLFYGTMLPWEHDEMGSVFGYLISKIAAICGEVTDDLRQLMKRTPCDNFWDILPMEQRPPLGAIDCESDLIHFDRQFLGLAGLGPEFLYRILQMDQLSRRNMIIVNTRS